MCDHVESRKVLFAAARGAPLSRIAMRYQLKSLLEQGGNGAVYAATDTMSSRDVAVKLLHLSPKGAKRVEKRFVQELQ